jgi:DNA-binding transcriptional ArsR family regulator
MARVSEPDPTARYAGMLAAVGTEPRLRVFRLLLAAHPDGLVVGEILDQTGISASTLSHHLDKLRQQDLVTVQRQGTFLRYRVDAATVRELLGFFYAECCTRNPVIDATELLGADQR